MKKWRYNFICPELGFAFKLSTNKISYLIPYVFLGTSFYSLIKYNYSPDYNISPFIDSKEIVKDIFIAGFGLTYLLNIKSYKCFNLNLIISSKYRYIDIEDEINFGIGVGLKLN